MRIGVLAPVVLAITYIGAFQGSKAWGDLYALLFFGLLGWVMKRMGWPRPPLILGFVLGALVERYMFISVERYGWEWLWLYREGHFAPWVDILFLLTIYGVLGPIVRSWLQRRKADEGHTASAGFRIGFDRSRLDPDVIFGFAVLALFVTTFTIASGWEFGARLVPQVVSVAGILFTGSMVFLRLFVVRTDRQAVAAAPGGSGFGPDHAATAGDAFRVKSEDIHFDIQADYGGLDTRTILVRAVIYSPGCCFSLAQRRWSACCRLCSCSSSATCASKRRRVGKQR